MENLFKDLSRKGIISKDKAAATVCIWHEYRYIKGKAHKRYQIATTASNMGADRRNVTRYLNDAGITSKCISGALPYQDARYKKWKLILPKSIKFTSCIHTNLETLADLKILTPTDCALIELVIAINKGEQPKAKEHADKWGLSRKFSGRVKGLSKAYCKKLRRKIFVLDDKTKLGAWAMRDIESDTGIDVPVVPVVPVTPQQVTEVNETTNTKKTVGVYYSYGGRLKKRKATVVSRRKLKAIA